MRGGVIALLGAGQPTGRLAIYAALGRSFADRARFLATGSVTAARRRLRTRGFRRALCAVEGAGDAGGPRPRWAPLVDVRARSDCPASTACPAAPHVRRRPPRRASRAAPTASALTCARVGTWRGRRAVARGSGARPARRAGAPRSGDQPERPPARPQHLTPRSWSSSRHRGTRRRPHRRVPRAHCCLLDRRATRSGSARRGSPRSALSWTLTVVGDGDAGEAPRCRSPPRGAPPPATRSTATRATSCSRRSSQDCWPRRSLAARLALRSPRSLRHACG